MTAAGWRLESTYADLPEPFWQALTLPAWPRPTVVQLNRALAGELGLDADRLAGPEGAGWFAGGTPPPGARPLAMAYAGHQFGHFAMLGDGRAALLGEQIAPDGRRWDIHLKGSGRTRFARGGDGRAALGPMLREYLISEAMHALGIPTTRALAVVATGAVVHRDSELPGAVLVRVAASHLRVGTLVFAAASGRRDLLAAIVAHACARHVPPGARSGDDAHDLLAHLVRAQARLIAAWMAAGFIHGVMNTDNMALSGETIDYGPCAFLDAYDPATVFSSIDRHGRYAYANQPAVAQWNLARAIEACLPLLGAAEADALAKGQALLAGFAPAYAEALLAAQRARLGLTGEDPGDAALAQDLLAGLARDGADYHLAWLDLLRLARGGSAAVLVGPAWSPWLARWRERGGGDPVRLAAAVPRIIPRNHRVEEALAAAVAGDWRPWDRLLAALRTPFADSDDADALMIPPPPDIAACHRTFCGT